MGGFPDRHIAIVGNIASGKSTVTTLCGELMPQMISGVTVVPVLERFEDNPFLARFYEDPKRWAFPLQVTFLLSKLSESTAISRVTGKIPCSNADRLYALTWLLNSREEAERILQRCQPIIVVQDASIEQYMMMYAAAQLDPSSFELYRQLYTALVPVGVRADLFVCLQAHTHVLMERITLRAELDGREYEGAISEEYLRLLEAHLDAWLKTEGLHRVLRVNVNAANLVSVERPVLQEEAARRFSRLRSLFGFGTGRKHPSPLVRNPGNQDHQRFIVRQIVGALKAI